MSNPMHPTDDAPPASVHDEILQRYGETIGVTQDLERDIIQFLSSKFTANATLTAAEIAELYQCPLDRAQRVINSLIQGNLLVSQGADEYKVNI
jgi:hypothetical protein